MSSRISFGVWAFLPLVVLAVVVEAGCVALIVALWGDELLSRLIALPAGLLLGAIWWLVRAMLGIPDEPAGVVIPADEHPALWREVVETSRAVGVRSPDRLVVTMTADVTARDVSGGVDLCIGFPLLAAQSVPELRATAAHALAHCATPGTHRLAQALEWVQNIRAVSSGPTRWALGPYVTVYQALSAGPIAALEHEADELSVRAVGAPVALAAMRRLVVLDEAWERVVNDFVPLFEAAGRRAPLGQALLGVLDADPPEELSPRDEPAEVPPSSPHLPLEGRIAVVEEEHGTAAASLVGLPLCTSLLDGEEDALEYFESEHLIKDWPLSTWDEVAAEAGSHNVRGLAHQIGSVLERQGIADTSLGGVLTILEHQHEPGSPRLAQLLGCDTDEEAVQALDVVLTAAAVDAGQAFFVSDWSEVLRAIDVTGEDLDASDAARLALTETDGVQILRAWLASHQANLDGPVGRHDQDHGDWLAAASHMTGPWKGRCDVHLWSTGMLAVPIDPRVVKADKSAYTTSHQRDRLMEVALQGAEAGRTLPNAFWVDRADVVGGDLGRGLVRVKITMTLASGVVHELRSAVESEMVESAEAVGSAFGYLMSIPFEA